MYTQGLLKGENITVESIRISSRRVILDYIITKINNLLTYITKNYGQRK